MVYTKEKKQSMSSIPEDMYLQIFLKVPDVKSLIACMFVCKTWYSLISSPDFVKKQLNLTIQRNKPSLMLKGFDKRRRGNDNVIYTIGYDSLELLLSGNKLLDSVVEIDYPFKLDRYSVQLMGCCDGLVCLWYSYRKVFCLWNPVTKEYKKLPESNIENVDMATFGYDNKNNDYKLLVVPSGTSTWKVYSLVSNSWKTNNTVPYWFPYISKSSGVHINGDRHWLAKRQAGSSEVVVVSLDISSEIFKEIELHEYLSEKHLSMLNLGVLQGCLCLFFLEYPYFEIWVMQNYGVRESWIKRHSLKHEKIEFPLIRGLCGLSRAQRFYLGLAIIISSFYMTLKMAVLQNHTFVVRRGYTKKSVISKA